MRLNEKTEAEHPKGMLAVVKKAGLPELGSCTSITPRLVFFVVCICVAGPGVSETILEISGSIMEISGSIIRFSGSIWS